MISPKPYAPLGVESARPATTGSVPSHRGSAGQSVSPYIGGQVSSGRGASVSVSGHSGSTGAQPSPYVGGQVSSGRGATVSAPAGNGRVRPLRRLGGGYSI